MRADLADILLSRWRKEKLAHFYILETGHFPKAKELLQQKIKEIMEAALSEELKAKGLGVPKNVWDHPDFLLISPDDAKKDYSLDEFSEKGFFNFIELRPYQLKWRFICIEDAFKVGNNLSNKLLKTLEEPPQRTTIFFLNPYAKPFMATIQSRAITLRYGPELPPQNDFLGSNLSAVLEKNRPLDESDDEKEIRDLLAGFIKENKGLGELIEKIKGADRLGQKEAYELLLDLERSYIGSYEHKQKVMAALEWFQTSQAFNNPSAERFFNLLNTLQNP